MKRKSSVTRRLLGNFNRLIPFVGFLLVVAGILGLIFVQKPLEESQDLRSDASEGEEVFLPNIMATNPDQDIYVNEESTISLDLNLANGMVAESVNVVFNIIADFDVPFIVVNAGSGLRSKVVEIEDVNDGYLVRIEAVPNNIDWNTPPSDVSFLKIRFTPPAEGEISINFDPNNTYMQTTEFAYAIDAQTMNYDIEVRPINCDNDAYECEDGTLVGRVPPNCNFAACPNIEEPEIKQCNERCDSNADCEVGHRCFDTGSEKRCRLAISPSSSNCSQLSDQGCNRSCSSSDECREGLSCWDNKCRNPENTDSTTCADLTPNQQAAVAKSCGEECSSNAGCAVNLRCYDGACKLAANPSSLTCTATTKKTVSKIYDEEGKSETSLTEVIKMPVQKGENIIPDDDSSGNGGNGENGENANEVTPTKRIHVPAEDDVPVNETAFDLILKMIKDKQQGMPTTIILIGIVLLIASLLTLLIARIVSFRPRKTHLPHLDNKTISIKSHKVKPGEIPIVIPKSSLKSKKGNSENDKKNKKVKEFMGAHKFKPKAPEPKQKPRPMIKPIVKDPVKKSEPESESKLIKDTPRFVPKTVQDAKVKELLKKINQQSKEQNKG